MKYILSILFLLFSFSVHGQSSLKIVDPTTGYQSTQQTEPLGGAVTNKWPNTGGRHVMLVSQNSAAQTYVAGDVMYASVNGDYVARLPIGSANYVIASIGGFPVYTDVTTILGNGYIKNQTSQQTSANFNIDGKGAMAQLLVSGLASTGVGSYAIPVIDYLGNFSHISLSDGYIPIGDALTNDMVWATITAGNGISVTNGHHSITLSANAATFGGWIQNQYTAQTSAGFDITAGAPVKTSNFVEAAILNDATNTSGTGVKTGLKVASTGTWTSDVNYGINLQVTGGTTAYDVSGTGATWNVKANGDATFNSATLSTPLSIASGGTGSVNGAILNQYTAQTSAGYNITAGAAAKTANFIETTILNDATATNAALIKTGIALTLSGSWAGGARGLIFDIGGGGTNNYDVIGTSTWWTVDNTGNGNFNTVGLLSPLTVANGGTGVASTSQNFAFIGPTSGSGAPTFRALVVGDLPAGVATDLTEYDLGTVDMTVGGADATFTTASDGKRDMLLFYAFSTTNRTGPGATGALSVGVTAPNYTDQLAGSNVGAATASSRFYDAATGADINTIAAGTTVTVHRSTLSTDVLQQVRVVIWARRF